MASCLLSAVSVVVPFVPVTVLPFSSTHGESTQIPPRRSHSWDRACDISVRVSVITILTSCNMWAGSILVDSVGRTHVCMAYRTSF